MLDILQKAELIIETIIHNDPPMMSFSQLQKSTQLGSSRLTRLLYTLVDLHWLEKDPISGHYRMGKKWIEWGKRMGLQEKPEDKISKVLFALANRIHCSTAYFELIESGLILFAKGEIPDAFRYIDQYASSPDVLKHAFGRTIVAFLPEEQQSLIIQQFSDSSQSISIYKAMFQTISQQGYYAQLDGCNPNLWRLVVPINQKGILGYGAVGLTSFDIHPSSELIQTWLKMLICTREMILKIFSDFGLDTSNILTKKGLNHENS